jgi:hypothetical protein
MYGRNDGGIKESIVELEAFARNAMSMVVGVKGVIMGITVLLDGAAVVGHLAAYRGVVCGWCDNYLGVM